ncbi:MAG: flavin monoamine oxidase family protein [Alphaproteobacteria bacterium]
MTDTDVAIVGAGAAGLAAAKTLGDLGVPFVLLEASHRIGGRAFTEEVAPGAPFDLGCHWMHSASRNPFVAIADAHGFDYDKLGFSPRMRIAGAWASAAEEAERDAFMADNSERIATAAVAGPDLSAAEVTGRAGRWAPLHDYFFSLWTSFDVDRVSVVDLGNYLDTEEDWPLKQGFGALVARHAAAVPVTLNAQVSAIDWSGRALRLSTPKGEVQAQRVIVSVSTGILAGGHIRFDPELPDWKQRAIAALPLGNHNRICLIYDRNVFGEEVPRGAAVLDDGADPMSFSIRPFGYDYVVGLTGGRFADWLERAGEKAAVDLARENLKKAFGADIVRHVVGHNVTAWRGDPWVRGAYSAALPGQASQRPRLAEPLDGRLFFAGEATSTESYSTAHGAHLTGIDTAYKVARTLGKRD